MVFDLQPPAVTAFDTIVWPLTPSAAQLAALQSGLWYADVHTQGTGIGGELRGQFSAAGTDRVATGVARATQVANVTGGLDADSLTGDDGPNTLRGGPGEDSIAGGGGDDVIDGGPGADTLSGDAGDDVILSRDGASDHVACGPGTDSVVADPEDVIAADCEIAGIRASDRTRPSLTQVRLFAHNVPPGQRDDADSRAGSGPVPRHGAALPAVRACHRDDRAAPERDDELPGAPDAPLARRAQLGSLQRAYKGPDLEAGFLPLARDRDGRCG